MGELFPLMLGIPALVTEVEVLGGVYDGQPLLLPSVLHAVLGAESGRDIVGPSDKRGNACGTCFTPYTLGSKNMGDVGC